MDRENGGPLYLRLARHIETSIVDGHLSPGDRLDGEIGLAETLGVSRQTMRKAIDELVRSGLLVRRHGSGTQVLPTRADRTGGGVEGLYDELKRADRRPSTKVITLEVRGAEVDIAEELGLGPGDEVTYLERVREADGVPIAIMRNWIPTGLTELDARDLETHGFYEILRKGGVRMRMAQQSIGAEGASSVSARLLGVKKGMPLLTIETTTYADSGKPVELGRHEYRGDMYRFPVTKVERQYGTEATR
ncbi:DNA-binding GntR family transcriptional regulator [Marmoricola sp. URHA0025 HA25]